MIHIKEFSFNTFQTRCCVVWDEDGICAFVDPGFSDASERTELVSFVESKGLKPSCIMLTHAHFDHTYGVADLARTYGIPVYMDRKETFTIENTNPYVCGAYGLPLPEAFEAQDFPGGGARSGEDASGAASGGAAVRVGSLLLRFWRLRAIRSAVSACWSAVRRSFSAATPSSRGRSAGRTTRAVTMTC